MLPIALLLLASLAACGGPGNTPPVTSPPDAPPDQGARPLSANDRMAMDEFAKQQQAIDEEWDQLHKELDLWRAGLTPCHRSSAEEALQDFAVSFNGVTEQARDLPRASTTRELADILIAAAEAEEAAFHQLRDRWQPNTVSLFEQVEEQRSNAARAQKEAEDLAMELQEKYEKIGEFSDAFDVIKNDWNKFHDDYAQLRKEAGDLDSAAVLTRLEQLIARFDAVVEAVSGLPPADSTETLIEILQETAEAELVALLDVSDALLPRDFPIPAELQEKYEKMGEFSDALRVIKNDWNKFHDDYAQLQKEASGLDNATVLARLEQLIAQFSVVVEAVLALPSSDATESMIKMLQEAAEAELAALLRVNDAVNDALLSQDFTIPDVPSLSPDSGIPPPPTQPFPGPVSGGKTGPLLGRMGAVIEESEAVLKEVSRTIKTLVVDTIIKESEAVLREVSRTIKTLADDSPVEHLADIQDFNDDYRSLLVEWDAFHQGYNRWRETEGGCDRTEVLRSLDQFNLRTGELGRRVRDLPQSGYLLPMYTLLVEAAEREEGAIRALINSWRPFTVDAFKAADQERDNVNRLRRQAGIGLRELRDRP